MSAHGYSSQLGQDAFLDRCVFFGARDRVIVDVGAHDGVTFSNSLFFEQQRGWHAVCIEPNPTVFARLVGNRTATCLPFAVGVRPGHAEFTALSGYNEMLSGLTAGYDRRHLRRIERDLTRHGGTRSTESVEVKRLDALLHDAGVDHVDVLTVDIEGGELDALRSIDLQSFGVEAVVVENNYGGGAVRKEMRRQGYQLLVSIGWDDVFVPRPWTVLVA